tara:strand:+ start:172 stop:438 length:267 start_codon:yes stop_codon:yes gene_type:complete
MKDNENDMDLFDEYEEIDQMNDNDIKELIESGENGSDWFNAYGEVDYFIFDELSKIGKEFPIVDEHKPELNTVEAIKIIIKYYENNKG